MRHQKRAGLAVALDHVEHTLGQAGLDEDFGNLQGAERGHFRWFEHHGIAGGKRWRRLPAGDLLRVVPGADADDNAERHPHRIGPVAAEGDLAAIECRSDDAAEEFQAVGAGGRIGDDGFLDRLAGVERFQCREFAVALAHDVGGLLQHPTALCRAEACPFLLGALGRCNGLFHDLRCGGMKTCDHFAGCRIDAFDHAAGRVFDIDTVNEVGGLRLGFHVLSPDGLSLQEGESCPVT